jgi:hypothetical protein
VTPSGHFVAHSLDNDQLSAQRFSMSTRMFGAVVVSLAAWSHQPSKTLTIRSEPLPGSSLQEVSGEYPGNVSIPRVAREVQAQADRRIVSCSAYQEATWLAHVSELEQVRSEYEAMYLVATQVANEQRCSELVILALLQVSFYALMKHRSSSSKPTADYSAVEEGDRATLRASWCVWNKRSSVLRTARQLGRLRLCAQALEIWKHPSSTGATPDQVQVGVVGDDKEAKKRHAVSGEKSAPQPQPTPFLLTAFQDKHTAVASYTRMLQEQERRTRLAEYEASGKAKEVKQLTEQLHQSILHRLATTSGRVSSSSSCAPPFASASRSMAALSAMVASGRFNKLLPRRCSPPAESPSAPAGVAPTQYPQRTLNNDTPQLGEPRPWPMGSRVSLRRIEPRVQGRPEQSGTAYC